MSGLVRLNVNLNSDTAAILQKLAEERGLTFTEMIRRAISVYSHIESETRQGRRITTSDADGTNQRQVVLL